MSIGDLAALFIAAGSLVYTFGPLRAESTRCKRERAELRRRLDAVTAALLGRLPDHERRALARELVQPLDRDEAA